MPTQFEFTKKKRKDFGTVSINVTGFDFGLVKICESELPFFK